MATIKPIEGRSIHQIQSGQVIVDLCSVVKELVENSLDAGATSIEVRFKGNGLEAIEVQDNGNGIAPEDYESIALKHYTSKLASYDDLTSLQTFGFRGEALSSLCALSTFHITTARASEVPRGTKLEFEPSGKLKDKSVIANQKGTTVSVESIFKNLPVRRKELEKNLKREYGKVLGLLQAYACISTGVRFSVSNQAAKASKTVAFSTKTNTTTRENISNVYGAKTVLALLKLDLDLEMQPSLGLGTQSAKTWSTQQDASMKTVKIEGHISRPVVGEGRQTPDRQMFFVNSRPCALPQVSKAFNEVYKSYNVTQSPFIFADLILDTNAYDVNVSPDKRSILLHDQTALLDSVKSALTSLFDKHDQTVPLATAPIKKLPGFRTLSVDKEQVMQAAEGAAHLADTVDESMAQESDELAASSNDDSQATAPATSVHLMQNFAERDTTERPYHPNQLTGPNQPPPRGAAKQTLREEKNRPEEQSKEHKTLSTSFEPASELAKNGGAFLHERPGPSQVLRDFQARMSNRHNGANAFEDENSSPEEAAAVQPPIASVHTTLQKPAPGPITNAFDRMRPKRVAEETATITVGGHTTHMTFGTPPKKRRVHTPRNMADSQRTISGSQLFAKSLRSFAAPGTQTMEDEDDNDEDSQEDAESVGQLLATANSEHMLAMEADEGNEEYRPTADEGDQPLFVQDDEGPDVGYIDEDEEKRSEEARVQRMIAEAEEAAAKPSQNNIKRATNALKPRAQKDSTLQLIYNLESSVTRIDEYLNKLTTALEEYAAIQLSQRNESDLFEPAGKTAEERLSLTVSKLDFTQMRTVGQFNLGFILALRPTTSESDHSTEELFIIDQHAADEKYNFERLSANTIVQHQRLVHPKPLELTAVEEEIILEHPEVLARNGFQIETDQSGDTPVGRRCNLVSLPMSKEVTFTIRDLEELIALLGDNTTESPNMTSESVVRPSKVRKMLAMRACRSSIMVGRNLTGSQMGRVVRHMGEMDKPWNCPHGRPTMRHLFGMDGWQYGWTEGKGVVGMGEDVRVTDWKAYVKDAES